MTVMVIELYEALKEAGASDAKAQAAARAMADYNARFDGLEKRLDTGFAEVNGSLAEVRAQITMLKWMNGIVIAGVAGLIIKTLFP
jgi:hypothetical protein